MMDAGERMTVGIVVERRRIDHPWPTQRWRPVALLPGRPQAQPWTVLDEGEGWTRWYAGAVDLELYRADGVAYQDNLESARPAVYVVLRRSDDARGMTVLGATVDPGEADAHADAGDDIIEALPLPPAIAAWIRDFLERHPVVEPAFHKRRRDRADPEALAPGRRRPVPAAAMIEDDA